MEFICRIAKLMGVIIFILLFSLCNSKQPEIEKIYEDGVEVVINHLEPYELDGELSSLQLKEQFTIDFEKDEIAELGLVDIDGFDVDSEGSIYFYQRAERKGDLVYRFDEAGNFSNSFGTTGQGPGEVADPINAYISGKNEILIQDYSKFKLFHFNKHGVLIKETRIMLKSSRVFHIFPLENNNYLKYTDNFDISSKHRFDSLELCDSEFQMLMELDRCDYGPIFMANQTKRTGSPRVFMYKIRNKNIFVGHESRGYEILVFDLEGNLKRKIRKHYIPTKPPQEFIDNLLINMGRFKDRIIIPDAMPPFHYFFLDDIGRLYIRTHEKGINENEYIHEIFNPSGIFIARKSMPSFSHWMYPGQSLNHAKAKNGRFYCIQEKDSGYKELVVYKLVWR